MVAYGRLKTKENFKLLALKVAAVAYEKWSLILREVPNEVIWPKNFWYFGKLVAEERWSRPEVRLYVMLRNITVVFSTGLLFWEPSMIWLNSSHSIAVFSGERFTTVTTVTANRK